MDNFITSLKRELKRHVLSGLVIATLAIPLFCQTVPTLAQEKEQSAKESTKVSIKDKEANKEANKPQNTAKLSTDTKATTKEVKTSLPKHNEEKIQQMYNAFIVDWMAKLQNISKINMEKITYDKHGDEIVGKYIAYGPESTHWIKKTDASPTTHVGYLKYKQKVYEKRGKTLADAKNCEPCLVQENNVTEIFRFTNGKWVY